ncbi:hypothetical protein CVV68_07890 [Arthrobacter livingstonensis]|uniref:Uncharacterized protein n=1 Tax=Arthrobacter livingstonensis TaxID=670078 RepID=A0A2V5LA61_9MICC|nr:hypothetical protein CVV68_07890 [Arthrobacter livingstonensis]
MTAGAGGTGEFITVGYAPLSEGVFFPSSVLFLGPWTYAGVATLAAGMLALAFWSGYRTARRRWAAPNAKCSRFRTFAIVATMAKVRKRRQKPQEP